MSSWQPARAILLQVVGKAELDVYSNNSENEMPSKRPRRYIIPDPQNSVETVQHKLTTAQKKQQDEERTARKAGEKGKAAKKVADKVVKEEKRKV